MIAMTKQRRSFIQLVTFVGVLGIVNRAREGNAKSLSDKGALGTSLSTQELSSHVKEREVVSERFLVICPFCGSKNKQDTTKCQSCGDRAIRDASEWVV